MIIRDSCQQLDTRNSSKNLASSSCGLRPGDTGPILEQREGVRREPQSFTTPTPRFPSRNCISGTCQTQWTFSAGKSTSRPMCVNTSCPTLTMSLIKEVGDNTINRLSCDVAVK